MGHVASMLEDGSFEGPEDAPVFVGQPYINVENADAELEPVGGPLTLIYKDLSGAKASKCAVYLRKK